jgi:hypothetical protein
VYLFDVEGGDARLDAAFSHGDREVPRFCGGSAIEASELENAVADAYSLG